MKFDEIMKVVEGKIKSIIVDVRAPGEYEGTDVLVLRRYHIPKAISIDYSKNFDPESYPDTVASRTAIVI